MKTPIVELKNVAKGQHFICDFGGGFPAEPELKSIYLIVNDVFSYMNAHTTQPPRIPIISIGTGVIISRNPETKCLLVEDFFKK